MPNRNEVLNNGLGKIDLISTKNNKLNLIEYKIKKSNEPLLRAILEIITYKQQVIKNIDETDGNIVLLREYNKKYGTHLTDIALSIVVPESAYEKAHPYAIELIKEYNIYCFTFNSMNEIVEYEFTSEVLEKNKNNFEKFKSCNCSLKLLD